MLTGVAGGVAETVDADPSLIRVVWALLVFLTGGLALVVYIVMAIVVPERPEGMEPNATGETASDGPATPAPVPEGGWVAPDGSTVPMATSAAASPARRGHPARRTNGGLVAGLVLILIGGFFLVRQVVPSVDLGFWWPIVAIGLGILLIIIALVPSRHPD
jgi:phage shock protein PspC (stress-responsive transcriptional regulator)